MGTKSNCGQLKRNLKKKFFYANSATQRCPKEIIKKFSDWRFFPLANLELRISPRIFEKIRNGPNGIIRGLGETDS
jgi:hypothetical protein